MNKAVHNITAAIDIGASSIKVVVANVIDSNHFEVWGVSSVPNTGMSKGIIHSLEAFTTALSQAIEEAQEKTDVQIMAASISLPCTDMYTVNSKGSAIVQEANTVTALDLANAFEAAKQNCMTSNLYLINHIGQGVELSEQMEWVKEPIGMVAERIQAHYHMMMLPVNIIQNFQRCFKQVGITADTLALSLLTASESSLTKNEKDMGVCLIDIGGATTKVAVYMENRLVLSHCFHWGGDAVTRDIASYFRMTLDSAEQLKLRYGCAHLSCVKPGQNVPVQVLSQEEVVMRDREELTKVMMARYIEIIEPVIQYLDENGALGIAKSGIVFTGGASQVEGLQELAEEMSGLTVHPYAHPVSIKGNNETINATLQQAQYASVCGALIHAAQIEDQQHSDAQVKPNHSKGMFYKVFMEPWLRFKQWLQQMF